jgi:hypothetical protein
LELVTELFVLRGEYVHDAGEGVVVVLQIFDVLVGFGQPVSGRVEFLSESALAVGNLAKSANLGVEQVFEVGVAMSENVPLDAGLLGEGDDR